MDIPSELRDFSGQCRLFPLPNVVLFPHVILPLHIFEPRYRQMTEDALDGDRLVTMVQAQPQDPAHPWTEPVPILDVACIGRIIRHERLPDGRFNMLLLGCQRVRLIHEVPNPKLYRVAEARAIEDVEPSALCGSRRGELVSLFMEVFQAHHSLDPDLSKMLHSDLPLGVLSDIMAHALEFPAAVKQTLLEEARVDQRVELLISRLRSLADPQPRTRRFPHPFSLN